MNIHNMRLLIAHLKMVDKTPVGGVGFDVNSWFSTTFNREPVLTDVNGHSCRLTADIAGHAYILMNGNSASQAYTKYMHKYFGEETATLVEGRMDFTSAIARWLGLRTGVANALFMANVVIMPKEVHDLVMTPLAAAKCLEAIIKQRPKSFEACRSLVKRVLIAA